MTRLTRNRDELSPEQIGTYLLGVLLAGVRVAIYRILFNVYVLSRGFEEGLITVLITASAMAMVVSVLPLSYIVDFTGKKRALIFSIVGTIAVVLIMVIFPNRWVFLFLNMFLGMFQALTQVSLGSEDSRYMTLLDRVMYYSLPLAFSVAVNYASAYLPNWIEMLPGSLSYDSELALIAVVMVGVFVFVDGQYNSHTAKRTPRRVIARLNVGGFSIPLIIDDDELQEPDFDPLDTIAEQVNFLLQGVLTKAEYAGPSVTIVENEDGDLVFVFEGEGEYIGINDVPEGEAKELIRKAVDLWTAGHLREEK
ncbi:MAG: hypothetical protein V2J07_04965 [Anaerolineae bacterium]|jgi:hypothetical protein|nr:hypothetical protein [Anaerolineae bacterium]